MLSNIFRIEMSRLYYICTTTRILVVGNQCEIGGLSWSGINYILGFPNNASVIR